MSDLLTRAELDRLLIEAYVEAQCAHYDSEQERRDIWRHETGLDGNGHGQLDYEPEES